MGLDIAHALNPTFHKISHKIIALPCNACYYAPHYLKGTTFHVGFAGSIPLPRLLAISEPEGRPSGCVRVATQQT
jgi:hypothetical protein